MDFDILVEEIKYRFYRCNELTGKQAEDYAWIAVNAMKRHFPLIAMNSLPTLEERREKL